MADVKFLEIYLPGRPTAWKRTGGFGKRRFEPKEQRNSKGVIQVHAMEAVSQQVLDGAWPTDWWYRVTIDAFWALAKGKHRKVPVPLAPRPAVPDGDNLMKLVGDALEHVLWDNDKQIVAHGVRKWTAKQGEPARTIVRVFAYRPGMDVDSWLPMLGV